MYLFFDTETTGLPKNWKAPVTDTHNWPRMVQIAWIYHDSNGNKLNSGNRIIKPEGYIIPKEVSKLHGITTERAIAEGYKLSDVLEEFSVLIYEASILVAHNIAFDEKIVGAEFIRNKSNDVFAGKKKICTMLEGKEFCKLPGPYGYKWPRLDELHSKLFGENFENAHDAAVDIEITSKCFWEMKKRKLI